MNEKEVERIKQEAIEEYAMQSYAMEFAKAQGNAGIRLDGRISDSTIKKIGKYTQEQVTTYLETPQNNEKQLRELSRYLSNTNFIYQRIVNYLPSISLDIPVVIPVSMDKFDSKQEKITKDYFKAIKYLDMLNITHEFIKVKKTIFREDIFYGIEYEDEGNSSYYIKPLNPDYCRISSIEDACYNFEFDFSFFDSDKTGVLLESYETVVPGFFKSSYSKYQKDKKEYQWQEVPSESSICIKMQEDLDYCYPYYVSVANDVADIKDYKDLEKVNTEQQNYRLLGFEIPRISKADKPDQFEIHAKTAMQFFNLARGSIDDKIGMFLTPMPVKDISFKDTANQKDKVANAVKNFYNTVGTSEMLFNGGTNSTALKYSIKTDEAILFQVYRSLERWLNRKFKRKFNNSFKVKLLDATTFNREEVLESFLKSAQYGVPVKTQIAALCGETPADMIGLAFLENQVLDIPNSWIPLSSSHTSTGSETVDTTNTGGRPESSDEDLTESGQNTRNNSEREG